MKYYLVLFAGLGFTMNSFAQSSLYQTSPQAILDHARSLYDQEVFAATFFDNAQLLTSDLPIFQQKQAELHRALAAIQLEREDGLGLLKAFCQDYAGQPAVVYAANFLGDYYFQRKRYLEAIEGFQLAPISLREEGVQEEISFKLGYSFFQVANYDSAAIYLNQVKNSNLPVASDALYYSGFIAMQQGNRNQAIQELKRAAQHPHYAAKVPYLLTSLYYQEGNYSEAISYAVPLMNSQVPLDRQEVLHLYLAEAYYAAKDFDNAAFHFEKYSSFNSIELTKEEYYKAGISFFEVKNYLKASEYLKIAALGNPELAQTASYFLGHSYVQLGNLPFAGSSFQVAASSTVNSDIQEDASVNLAKVNLRRGNFQAAIQELDAYLSTYPQGEKVVEVQNLLNDALLNSADYLRVMAQLNALTTKSTRLQQAFQKVAYYQALVEYRDSKYNQALDYLSQSQNYPVDRGLLGETYFWMGEIRSIQEDWGQAIAAYQVAIDQKKGLSEEYFLKSTYGLGYAYFNNQNYDLAEVQFQIYTNSIQNKVDPNYHEGLLRLGDCYFVQKKFSKAEATFQQAILEKITGQDYAYLQLALVQNYQGKNSAAIEQLNLLISKFPTSVYQEDAYFQKGQLFLEELNYNEAIAAFSELFASRPNSPYTPFALEGRAIANYSIRQYDQTLADYKVILEKYPLAENAEVALKGLQETLAVQERSEEFGQYLQSFKQQNPQAGELKALEYEAAKNLYLNQKYAQAAKALDIYIRDNPQSVQNSEVLYFSGDSYRQLGELSKAIEFFTLLEQQPPSTYRIKALQQLGKIELERKNYKEVLRYLEPILEQSRTPLEEVEVLQGILQAHFGLQNYPQTIVSANQLLAMSGILPDATPKALLIKGKALRLMGQYSDAEDSFGLLIQEYKTEQGAEALLLLALGYQEKGDLIGSNELIFDYSEGFSPFDYWYGSLFLLLAENYVELGELFQAKATLLSILDQSTNATVKENAASILNSLN
uniref:tetratricopeptide repeat protein n=1 Tax=Algoriphagus sp. TaxID=1872435 RepID=UPI004048932F